MWILCIVCLGILSPIIFMIVGKDKPGVYRSSMQALTYMICLIIAYIVIYAFGFALALVTHGFGLFIIFPLIGIIGLFSLYVFIKGAIEANNGNVFEPPITGNLAKQWFKV
jgi:uncharacterized membrane protein